MIEFQLAGIDIKTDHRGSIEIVAGTGPLRLVIGARPIVERSRVGGAPPDGAGLRVVGAWHPAAAPTGAPGVAPPGLHGFVGAGDGQELPFLRTRCGIDAEYWAAAGPFPALRADHHGAFGIKRCTG